MEEMSNASGKSEKGTLRAQLFAAAVKALEADGWTVERVRGSGKASVRRLVKGKQQEIVSIRTTQDQWIAFPRTPDDSAWATLKDVDSVVASSVDDYVTPRFALVHKIPGEEMRRRFDRAYAARKNAKHIVPVGHGVWLSLYEKDVSDPVSQVGGGIGLAYPHIARIPLSSAAPAASAQDLHIAEDSRDMKGDELPLTIAEAKRRLAISLGVDASDIKITISS
jgi:hypothetical protein